MTTISLRVEDDLKTKIEELCESIGMNVSTFFTIYAKKAVKEQAIPFVFFLSFVYLTYQYLQFLYIIIFSTRQYFTSILLLTFLFLKIINIKK